MIDPEAAVVRPDGLPAERYRLYRRLAAAVEASRRPATVVFAAGPLDRSPWIVARPSSLLATVLASPVGSDTTALPAFRPPDGATGAIGSAVPFARPGERRDAADTPDPIRLSGHVRDGDWLAAQTIWIGGSGRPLWASRRWWFAARSGPDVDARADAIATGLAHDWAAAVGARHCPVPLGRRAEADWLRLGVRTVPRAAWIRLPIERSASSVEPTPAISDPLAPDAAGHALVLGASGSGKSWFLADRAARAIRAGTAVVAIDLHGDLTPGIVARLGAGERARLLALDLTDGPVPGIAALAPSGPAARATGHLVAALKRLSPDGAEVYWGFRLERLLDAFVRLARDEGGSLRDVHALLTDPDRREAARLSTRRPELARFLDELGPIVRRTPDVLWSAAARLSKVVGVPAVGALLAPEDGGLPVERLVRDGRSLLLRLPFAELGPEAAGFAASLVLARVYLGIAAHALADDRVVPVTIVLDEVHGLSPRLVAEVLGDGRKFGFRLWVSTQYPDRIAGELRSAVAGVVRDVISFRVPPPGIPAAARWLGEAPRELAPRLLDLATGRGLRRGADSPDLLPVDPVPPPAPDGRIAWAGAVRATRTEFPPAGPTDEPSTDDDRATERLLLAALAATEQGTVPPARALVAAAARLPGPPLDPALLADRLPVLLRQGALADDGGAVRLTPVGERRLGLGAPTGATRESAEHRALLLATFRLFARHGHRLEIVRQGRFDTRLPDAVYRQLPPEYREARPVVLARTLAAVQSSWAWRCFRGQDVHVEAEVTGADRPARIRRGVEKAHAVGAFPLFVVADAARARRVRRTLRELGLDPTRAQVWTLRSAATARPLPSQSSGGAADSGDGKPA